MTEEEIQKANVGEAKKHNSTILLEEYTEQWSAWFKVQEEKILKALNQISIKVEHVGSTSVPGLCAKPIVDIVLEVPDSSNESEYVPQLEQNGFWLKIKEPEWFEHRMFKGKNIPTNLHVFTAGCSEVQKMIRFRDHLRNNPVDMELYQSKKKELSLKNWEYIQNYADAKTEVVKDIITRVGS
ncbi:MAG: GrpB family protein [Bdellovibrionales bacterium]|nr:GrpB family protein [Bdellovibrionales bacterium]